jgi:hypothetical protein
VGDKPWPALAPGGDEVLPRTGHGLAPYRKPGLGEPLREERQDTVLPSGRGGHGHKLPS